MDDFTEKHFRNWLDRTVPDDDRDAVEAVIRELLVEHPDLPERLSWPEMRNLAERNERTGIR